MKVDPKIFAQKSKDLEQRLSKEKRGLRLLSFDGGGIRGLLSIHVLRMIEEECGTDFLHSFDLIGGTSTGGIISLALGLKHYSVDKILEVYNNFGEKVFGNPKIFGWNFFKLIQTIDFLMTGEPFYSGNVLHALIQSYLGNQSLSEYGECPTKVFVITVDKFQNPASGIKLRSYPRVPTKETCKMSIAKVAQSTSAAPTYFPSVKDYLSEPVVRKVEFVDGGVFENNPSFEVLKEAKRLWPDKDIDLFISIGTGETPFGSRENSWIPVGDIMAFIAEMTTSSRQADRHVTEASNWLAWKDKYIRINPSLGEFMDLDDISDRQKHNLVQAALRWKNSFEGTHLINKIRDYCGKNEFYVIYEWYLLTHRVCKVRPVTVFLSAVATSVLARLSTFWNSATRWRMRECMYAFEHLMW